MDNPSREDFFKIGADVVLARSLSRDDGRTVSPEEVYTEGSDINIMIAGSSAMADEVMRVTCAKMNDLLFGTAQGDALDRLVLDRFNGEIPRLEASASIGDVLLFRDAAFAASALVLPTGTVLKSKSGLSFETVFPATFSAGAIGPITVRARATETGPAASVLAGEISSFLVPIQGVSVTNPNRFAGGSFAESDARYLARAQKFFSVARRGVLAAIEFGALRVPGVTQASVFEDVDAGGHPTGWLDVYVSDQNGAGNAALASLVLTELEDWRCGGVTVIVSGSTPVIQDVVVVGRFESGTDSTLAFEEFRRRLVSTINTLGPGDTLLRSIIVEVGRGVPGLIVENDFVQVPAGDIVPTSGETIRVTLASITNA